MLGMKKIRGRKLKWGISGCGKFAENKFLPAMLLLRKSSAVSVFSNDAVRAKTVADKFAIRNNFSDYDEFLKSDIDAVYIGSANVNHYQQVLKAAAAGKHILCEKPMAMTSAEAEEMVEACKKNNVQFAVNYVYRFHPIVIKARELLQSNLIGSIVSINMNFNIDFPPNSNFRFIKEESGGGALRDLGTHMIDLLRFFGGEIVRIKGVTDNIIYNAPVDDFAAGMAKFQDGGYGYFNVSFNSKKAFNRIDIVGHKGSIGIDNLIGARLLPARMTILREGEAKKAFNKRGNKLLHLLRSVQKSFLKNEQPSVTGEDGLINMRLMEQLERNAFRD
jgi:D-xylose 1-dehydrogenase (NADP+, D-xylono-1,5-lactone-forming)